MEFIPINDTKLKIILSKSDLAEFDLRADELDYSNTETKRMFWDIIGRAKRSVGFNCDGMRVLVQLYTCRDGGCEMFISSLGDACRECYESEALPSSFHCKTMYKKDKKYLKEGVFCFESLEWLITVCRRLYGIGYSGESSAYIGDDRRFYLFLDGLDAAEYMPLDEYSFICEYGESENTDATMGFLCEHGKEICHTRAVETLSAL
ncbi:MAG: adaptor protein MecA [Clostridia bacterium]|nr:adaptor protein MecA [Clostridia bacterium]